MITGTCETSRRKETKQKENKKNTLADAQTGDLDNVMSSRGEEEKLVE